MNPLIKKQFIIEAWNYNQSLEIPFFVSYYEPTDFYYKNNWFKFSKSLNEKNILTKDKQKYYTNIVEKSIENEINNSNSRKIIISGDEFLESYFKYFFEQHTELQIDLLKFFNKFLNYNFKSTDFLKQFDKQQIDPFLNQINYWFQFSNENLTELENLMLEKQFDENFRISILKKYVNHNLKTINKTPSLSKGLEDFLFFHYPSSIDSISTNVVAIKNRLSELNEEQYLMSFSKNNLFCLHEEINTDNLLKTFQIAGWTYSSYNSVIQTYHNHLLKKYNFEIKTDISQNQKKISTFISMKENHFTLDDYKKDLLVLFKFYRANPEHKPIAENLEQIFLNNKLNENLTPHGQTFKPKKI